MLEKMIAYAKDAEVLGEVVGIDFANETVTVDTDVKSHTFRASEVEFLKEAFILHDLIIFDKDVLGDVHGNMYLVELHKDGDVTLHHLTEDFEIKQSGTKMTIEGTILKDFEEVFDLEGNFYELKNALPKKPEFNVQIVKDFNGKYYTYFYACNNKQDEEIDLIKVLFLGSTLLEEEEHERRTLSYEDYRDSIESGIYTEVSPQELQSYVTGLMYGKKQEVKKEEPVCGVTCDCNPFECKEEDKEEVENFDFNDVLKAIGESMNTVGENASAVADSDLIKSIGKLAQRLGATGKAEDKGEDAPEEVSRCKKCNQGKDLCDCELWD